MPDLRSPRFAVSAMFLLNGGLFGIWASRIPAIVDRLELSEDRLGLLLLCLAGGAILAFPFAGQASDRLGAAATSRIAAVAYPVLLACVCAAPSFPLAALGLLLFGAAHGGLDVAMNAWGAEVERQVKRHLMPVFHAMYSLGAGLGAASGYAAVNAGLGPLPHAVILGTLLAAVALAMASRPWESARTAPAPGGVLFTLPRGALALVGLVAAAGSVGEGAMADWSAVFIDRVLGASRAEAALGYAVFSVAMVATRLSGAVMIARLGAAGATRASGLAAAGGVALVIASPAFGPAGLGVALSGFLLAGVGYAVVMPLAFSRAAAEPGTGAGRAIAGVATLGYGGMLLGPPVIGFAADMTSLRAAFGILVALACVIVAMSRAMAPAEG
ncbi:MFS transporter [Mesobaculum littorinae]|uniref:MFS transporter n=1 Tax=Mesobaculum littorinae TaxID=2486419 RepID=A0A438AE10_9RHOB|nr:MFS transporter [Mesobaculum littorinae]RVV96882.1 MFS transporter [Mesobaculum littorinae]